MLILHVDAENVQQKELGGLPTPPATETWQPVAHEVYDRLVRESLHGAGIEVHRSSYGLSRPTEEGYRHRLFAVLETQDKILDGQAGLTIGLRNSTDQTLSAGLVFGSRVMVCDNMAFAGEYVIRRKHTPRILDDLPALIDRGVGKYFDHAERQRALFERLHARPLSDQETSHVLVEAAAHGVISYAGIGCVRWEWVNPRHDAFAPRTAWSLFNAFTEAAKKYVPAALADRTLRLTGLFHSLAN